MFSNTLTFTSFFYEGGQIYSLRYETLSHFCLSYYFLTINLVSFLDDNEIDIHVYIKQFFKNLASIDILHLH